MRWSWSWGCRHYLSFVFGVNACFVFDFVVFYLWENSDDITHWQSRHTGWFQIPYLWLCPSLTDRKISLISSANCLASLIREPIFFQIITGLMEFGFKLIVFFFQKCMRITNGVLPTIKCMDKILGKVSPSPYSPKITVAYRELRVYFTVQIPPFIDWTWTAEMTLSLQVDIVLSDAASPAPMRHILFNRCCHFAYGDAVMWLKCVRHPKNATFTQNFAMSATPDFTT